MINIPGYQILDRIYESVNSWVYRGIRKVDEKPVIIKTLKEDYPSPQILTRYKQEYEITKNLNIEGVVRALSLEKYGNSWAIAFEDFGGKFLVILINNGILTAPKTVADNEFELSTLAVVTDGCS